MAILSEDSQKQLRQTIESLPPGADGQRSADRAAGLCQLYLTEAISELVAEARRNANRFAWWGHLDDPWVRERELLWRR